MENHTLPNYLTRYRNLIFGGVGDLQKFFINENFYVYGMKHLYIITLTLCMCVSYLPLLGMVHRITTLLLSA